MSIEKRLGILAGKKKAAIKAAWAAAVAVLTFAASASAQKAKNITPLPVAAFTDSREGKSYKKVTIGTQTWMGQNLSYDVPNVTTDVCYGEGGQVYDSNTEKYITISNQEVQANCAKYGRLYGWETAKNACPSGWHLPSDAEWTQLTDFVGSSAGKKLKSKTGWEYYSANTVGTDEYGFSALPCCGGYSGVDFYTAEKYGYWWSATEHDDNTWYAWSRDMYYYNEIVARGYYDKLSLFAVRCVQD